MSDRHPTGPVHATAIAIDGRCVLIAGEAGSGKTTLALEIIRRARAADRDAGLIADDRTDLVPHQGTLLARCPAPIRGKIEIRGFGIADATAMTVAQAPVALLVRLVEPARARRFAEGETETLAGCRLPCLRLPAGPAPSAATAVFAALGLPVWL
ncbi:MULTISPECIES: HPr kinase/phosphorylase [unclassified Roseitalea]|uniref:HPr kinase/phosphorylase n=1 Tax=unclassified Roseitalea TaxID=2639107 RepID=UPI00273E4DD8|nr:MULTISPECIES: HPr kinase/phosphorylase [unclassified Roseitalea]